MMPKPDLTVNLTGSPDLIGGRKQELSVKEIRTELERWNRLPIAPVLVVSAHSSPQDVAAVIWNRLARPS